MKEEGLGRRGGAVGSMWRKWRVGFCEEQDERVNEKGRSVNGACQEEDDDDDD